MDRRTLLLVLGSLNYDIKPSDFDLLGQIMLGPGVLSVPPSPTPVRCSSTATTNSSGCCDSLRVMSRYGSFQGRTRPAACHSATTASASVLVKGRMRTELIAPS